MIFLLDNLKEIRWRQRFENYEKSYRLLERYADQQIESEIEKAGMIQFFEMAFELAWKVMKDYLESEAYEIKSPREAIKQSFQIGLIDNGHVWIEGLTVRNLTVHTYDEQLADKMIDDIKTIFFPELKKFYERLLKEL
ncbi:nucleotidyltransferase substrate binding protein [Fusibacter sp. 3D3]|uniref:nucleotidyltransferase substrate binding protein n=1 Tax=Fusibacter sp. 3D3 TaxID=1048380 RepID=UPI000855E81D|nr:nucleotidyltransferase substrate binding protein [Fusibacter sp. 3D3]GAU76530.1 nucleotidyltransferase [Fusibacter sp. 3D3]